MKTNMINTNSIKTYICAVVMLLGMSVNAWGDLTTSETLPIAIAGVYDADDGYATCTKTITFNTTYSGVSHYVCFTEYDDEINTFALTSNVVGYNSGYFTPSYSGNVTLTLTIYGNTDGTFDGKIIVTAYSGSSPYPTLEIPIKVTITGSCTSHSITLTDAGSKTGGSFSTNVSSSCQDETITITATPDAGYRVATWTVLDGNAEDVELSGTGNTRTFAMPNSDTEVEVTFAAQTYDVTLKPNGGSGSDQVVSVTYADEPPTTLKGGGAIVIPTRTGYAFDGYYDNTSGGTQYYSYKGSPKALVAEELWDKPNDANLYARWIANITTVTLDKGTGGSTDGDALIAYDATEYGYIDHAVNNTTGYHLDGYYTNTQVKVLDADGSFAATDVTGYITDGKWSNTSDEVTLYAHWALNTYTISFDKNGGSGSMDGVEKDYGSTYALPACGFTAPSGKVFDGWAEGSAEGTKRTLPYNHTVTGNITFYALWRDGSYTDYVFSCAELTLTPHLVTDGTPIFITSAANKKVRSQDYITISGSGLTPNTPLTFPGLDSKFEVKKADGTAISTEANGTIDVNAYIFYTPAADATTDGIDKITGITVSVSGAKPKQVSLTQDIIGRHLPTAGYVIAGKKDNKWYALPSNMASTTNPKPSEIAVNDINNPSIAYTAASNIYGLEGPTTSGGGNNISSGNGQYVRLTMSIDDGTLDPHAAPLFGSATGTRTIGKSGNSQASSHLSEGWWWALTQTNTSISNPQDAKYTIKCANNTSTLSLRDNAGNPDWGLFASGVEELRLIPASNVVPTEAYFVEWGQHGGVVEVDAEGIDATSVVAHLGEATSSAITLVQTKASDAKNKSSKYNYTVNFGGSIDFAAAASNGALLTLEWKNGETVKAVSNIVVPKIVASNITINKANYPLKSDWNTEVHVLPGKTVTVDPSAYDGSNVTIKELNIYPGATVVASTGTLIATNLVLRNGWSRAGTKTYDVARLYVTPSTATLKATNVYADWYIDYDQYYPVAVPWNATVANFTYRYSSVAPSVGPTANIRLRYYDGASRATNVQEGVGSGANWKLYGADGCLSVPTTLTPSTGYAMTAKRPTGKAFSIIRMPLTLPSGTWGEGSWTTNGEQGTIGEAPSDEHKDQVSVTAHGTGSTPSYAQGWNLIANPYMSLHQGAITYTGSGTAVTYVNIPDVDFKEYDQQPAVTAKLKPASAFLIQAPETGTITFGTANRKASTPSFRVEENPESVPEQQAYIVLNNEQSEDMMGILVSDKYTSEYELNADLEKLLGDGTSLKTYMHYGDRNMAYVAINEVLAREWIPVTVRIPESGEYTYSLHEASIAGELEGIYLIDYQNGDHVTNLIDESYSFTAEAGTINGRFAINAIVGQRETPTDVDVINAGGDIHSNEPVKFIWNDKVFILHRGVIYDSTGKRVREINR